MRVALFICRPKLRVQLFVTPCMLQAGRYRTAVVVCRGCTSTHAALHASFLGKEYILNARQGMLVASMRSRCIRMRRVRAHYLYVLADICASCAEFPTDLKSCVAWLNGVGVRDSAARASLHQTCRNHHQHTPAYVSMIRHVILGWMYSRCGGPYMGDVFCFDNQLSTSTAEDERHYF